MACGCIKVVCVMPAEFGCRQENFPHVLRRTGWRESHLDRGGEEEEVTATMHIDVGEKLYRHVRDPKYVVFGVADCKK